MCVLEIRTANIRRMPNASPILTFRGVSGFYDILLFVPLVDLDLDLNLDFSFFMGSIMLLYQTQGLTIIRTIIPDVTWYSYKKEDTAADLKNNF